MKAMTQPHRVHAREYGSDSRENSIHIQMRYTNTRVILKRSRILLILSLIIYSYRINIAM